MVRSQDRSRYISGTVQLVLLPVAFLFIFVAKSKSKSCVGLIQVSNVQQEINALLTVGCVAPKA